MMAVELKGRQPKRPGGGRSGGPAPFLRKTYQIVEDEETDEVISWGEKGESFVVWKPVEFARDLLPAHFKHNNFSSFVRQLNTYGFYKVVPNRWEFANGNFRRGEQGLLCSIRRRKKPSSPVPPAVLPSAAHPSQSSPSPSAEVHSFSSTASPQPTSFQPPTDLVELSDLNRKLRRENQTLNSELARAKQHLEVVLGFVSKYVDIRQLYPILLMPGIGVNGGISGNEDEEQGEEEVSVKLFGVLLKDNDEVARRRKRRRCDGSGAGNQLVGGGL